MAATDLFFVSAALFIALLAFVWMTRPVAGAGVGAGGAH